MFDGACGMLTVAEETLHELAAEHKKKAATRLFGIFIVIGNKILSDDIIVPR